MIDWDRVAELHSEIGHEDFGEVVEIFLEEVDGAIETLGHASEPLEAQLHFLKGSALNLGFQQFADLCQTGETRAAAGETSIDLAEIADLYKASRDEFLDGMSNRFAA